MAISQELQDTIDRTFELSSTLLDQASILKQKVDSIEHDKAVAELTNKVIRIKARENWANAEVRAYRALKNNVATAGMAYDVIGNLVVDVEGKPVVDVKGKFVLHNPYEWEHIWKRVAEKLHKYRKNLVLQYAYGRNPANISGSLTIIVNED